MAQRSRNVKIRVRNPLRSLDDDPWQPRVAIAAKLLELLAESIRQVGLLQAQLARPNPGVAGSYQLAFGHRRVAACRLLHDRGDGEALIDNDVDGISDERMAVIALTENVARTRLTEIEVVRA